MSDTLECVVLSVIPKDWHESAHGGPSKAAPTPERISVLDVLVVVYFQNPRTPGQGAKNTQSLRTQNSDLPTQNTRIFFLPLSRGQRVGISCPDKVSWFAGYTQAWRRLGLSPRLPGYTQAWRRLGFSPCLPGNTQAWRLGLLSVLWAKERASGSSACSPRCLGDPQGRHRSERVAHGCKS